MQDSQKIVVGRDLEGVKVTMLALEELPGVGVSSSYKAFTINLLYKKCYPYDTSVVPSA